MSRVLKPRNTQRSQIKRVQLPLDFTPKNVQTSKRRSRTKPAQPFVREMNYRGVPYTISLEKKGFSS